MWAVWVECWRGRLGGLGGWCGQLSSAVGDVTGLGETRAQVGGCVSVAGACGSVISGAQKGAESVVLDPMALLGYVG